MNNEHREWHENGYKIFGLHEIIDGKCSCGYADCDAVGKHPRISRWNAVPHWSDEQLDNFVEARHFATGYGVLVDNLFVIDIDARNNGCESYSRLLEVVPEVSGAGMIVDTGSGGGSQHLFFSLPEKKALHQNLSEFKGIDFKSSGFVVGAGSLHESGSDYRCVLGSVMDIQPAPEALITMLTVQDVYRADFDGENIDVSNKDLVDILQGIDPDIGYDEWVRVGMALHHTTGGAGFELWDSWSSNGTKYSSSNKLATHWHSFGKSGNPVTLGTLAHYANWTPPVTFDHDMIIEPDTIQDDHIDLRRPPGLVGEVVRWINSQCMYPRENLAVAAALTAVANAGGMRYYDKEWGVRANLFTFCVAGSGTGKNAILDCIKRLAKESGISGALCGGIKSEQEIIRNILANQAANYTIDELGEVLSKIKNGNAHFLEGVIGTLMSAYSAAGGTILITGDLKRDTIRELSKELSNIRKMLDENEIKNIPMAEHRCDQIEKVLSTIDTGIADPFVSIFGLTTPDKFNGLMDFATANNGFLGRALIFSEQDDNPRMRKVIKAPPPSLRHLYEPLGYADMLNRTRIERIGSPVAISSTTSAMVELEKSHQLFWQMAEDHKGKTGLVAIPRRASELVAKVSLVLAMSEGTRTAEHVQWAHALVKHDIMMKLHLVNSNSSTSGEALMSALVGMLDNYDGITIGALRTKTQRKWKDKTEVDRALEQLTKSGHARVVVENRGRHKDVSVYYLAS